MNIRRAALPCMVLLALLVSSSGCGTRAEEKEEHEEAHKTGSHGGPLVEVSPEAVRSAGIAVDSVGPRSIEIVIELPGEIKLNAERSVDVVVDRL